MSSILKLGRHNEKEEIIFELKFQMSLTTRQRFEMMFKKTEEIKNYWRKVDTEKLLRLLKEQVQ